MKNLTYVFALVFSCLFFNKINAANKDGRILITAKLTTGQEVPAVTNSKAKGVVTFMLEEDTKTLIINGVFDSLSGPVTNCHLHKAVRGSNGGVSLSLLSYVKGNRIYGKIENVSKSLINAIMTDSIYINVHTALNTGGEIRGQLDVESDYHFWAFMSGLLEVPAVSTLADGIGSFVLSRDLTKLEYKVLVSGLSGPITNAHLHFGASGKTGGVAYPLSYSGNFLTGTLDVNSAFIDSLSLGKIYVNVHTAANPSGEVRGQLSFLGELAFDVMLNGANETTPVNTPAKGLMVGVIYNTLDSIDYVMLYDSMTPTAAHFHVGNAGQNGGVAFTLEKYSRAPNVYLGTVVATPDTIARFLKGGIYTNVHSATYTGGEIRGQTNTSVRDGFIADLCGAQEVPAKSVSAIGVGAVSMDRNRTNAHVLVATNGLTANATAGHIHKGAAGVNGSVSISFGTISATNTVDGYFAIPTSGVADSISNGLTYINIHTAANAGGEIRGQILKVLASTCLPTGVYELNGQSLAVKVFPNPTNGMVNLNFESNDNFDAQIVLSDLMGRAIITKPVKVQNGDNQFDMNTLNVSSGMYFLRLQRQNQILFSEKVFKQ